MGCDNCNTLMIEIQEFTRWCPQCGSLSDREKGFFTPHHQPSHHDLRRPFTFHLAGAVRDTFSTSGKVLKHAYYFGELRAMANAEGNLAGAALLACRGIVTEWHKPGHKADLAHAVRRCQKVVFKADQAGRLHEHAEAVG